MLAETEYELSLQLTSSDICQTKRGTFERHCPSLALTNFMTSWNEIPHREYDYINGQVFFFNEWEQNGHSVPFLESASLKKKKRTQQLNS